MPAIVNSGAAYIAAKVGASAPVEITDFVLANITGLDDTQPVDLAETLPVAGDIVYQAPASQSGYLSPDKVVYSLAMDTAVGDFTFNWLGLLASDGTLVAVAYLPATIKTASSGGVQGNNITRNFLLQFADAQLATGISVPAETWQIDQAAYLDAIDERERGSNRDIYGPAAFFDGGWALVNDAGTYKLQPGIAYVEGVRIVSTAEIVVAEGALPTDISLDVELEKGVDSVQAKVTAVRGAPADYVDGSGRAHYCVVVAHIDSGGAVQDQRTQYTIDGSGVLQFLLGKIGEQVPQSQTASTVQKGIVELATSTETQTGTDTARAVTPKGLADTVVDSLTSTSTTRPLSAAQGKALNDKTGSASTTTSGLVELATSTETQTGTDTARAVTPKGLADTVVDSLTSTSTTRPLSAAQGKALNDKTGSASTTKSGLVELATNTEAQAGTDTARAVTPAGLLSTLNARLGTGAPTTFAKTLLVAADAAAGRTALGLGAEATRWPAWSEVTSKPTTFTPSAHNHSATDITSGTLDALRIPNLDASKITAGTLGTARIPNLDAGKITSGTFSTARIPDLSATYSAKGGNTGLTQVADNVVFGSTAKFFTNDGGGNCGLRFGSIDDGTTYAEPGRAWEIDVSNDTTTGSFVIGRANNSGASAGSTTGGFEATFTLNGSTGNAYFSGDVEGTSSDIRVKDIEEVLEPKFCLEAVLELDAIRYREKAIRPGADTERLQIGLIAQQLQKRFPELTPLAPFDRDKDGNSKSGENYLTAKYERTTAVLVGAVKGLWAELQEVKHGAA